MSAEDSKRTQPWFHVTGGLYFLKEADGKITVEINDGKTFARITMEQSAFQSVMGFLSKSGDTLVKWEEAKRYLES